MENTVLLQLRAKKLGLLLKGARLTSRKDIPECARAIGVPEDAYQAYEMGERSPSLPELEMLAFTLKIPLDHFWGTDVLSESHDAPVELNPTVLVGLRQRMVGVLLRKTRMDAGLDLEGLAAKTGISVDRLNAYEFGEKPVPVPELDLLASALGYPVRHFQDQRGPVGAWIAQQRSIQDFKRLPPELQSFVSKPVNRPYLELAQRLSEMSVEKLRAVAEGLLEITL
jgi:transcriptional regulator with XRE-family HTH domain